MPLKPLTVRISPFLHIFCIFVRKLLEANALELLSNCYIFILKNDPSQSLQMIERPLLTPDELKSMPKGQFVVMKTGVHPMRVRLKLFKNWGISFNEKEPYTVADKGDREVCMPKSRRSLKAL